MALEYEDIDLGQVSEVTKEEFDLTKLEAEGFVTEIVIAGHDAVEFWASVGIVDEGHNADDEPIIALKVNNELVEHTKDYDEEYGMYDYLLTMNLPIGTSIKIYHNPNLVKKTDFFPAAYWNLEEDPNPETHIYLEIYKCSKNLRGIFTDCFVKCYDLPNNLQGVGFSSCLEITPHIPPTARLVEMEPAYVDAEDENGEYYSKNVPLAIYLDGLPEELHVNADDYTDFAIYVPYHLLEEAKSKFPDDAACIDALLPVSKVSEVGCGKLHRHELNIEYSEDGTFEDSIIVELSFLSPTSSPFFNGDDEIKGNFGDALTSNLVNANGMSVIVYAEDIHNGNGIDIGNITDANFEFIDILLSNGERISLDISSRNAEGHVCYINDSVNEII